METRSLLGLACCGIDIVILVAPTLVATTIIITFAVIVITVAVAILHRCN